MDRNIYPLFVYYPSLIWILDFGFWIENHQYLSELPSPNSHLPPPKNEQFTLSLEGCLKIRTFRNSGVSQAEYSLDGG